MLELKKLTGVSFDEIVEQAVRRIERSDSGWNNLQYQDPGMTLVDLFAWLKALQHEYISQIYPETRRRFLALLNIRPRSRKGASALLQLLGARESFLLPGETKWRAGEICFENPDPVFLLAAKLTAVQFGNGAPLEKNAFDGVRRFQLFCEMEGGKSAFTLLFDRPVPPDAVLSLYFEIAPVPGRNPVTEHDFFPLGKFRCEAWTAGGWRTAAVKEDETHGFLFSGMIRLQLENGLEQLGAGCPLRFVLDEDHYDYPPEITGVYENVLRVFEQDTLCRADLAENGALLPFDAVIHGGHRVFLDRGGRWEETADFSFLLEENGVRLQLPAQEKALVLSYAQGESLPVLGSGRGFAGQTLPFPWTDVAGVSLLVGEKNRAGEVRWDLWEQRDDFFTSKPGSLHFVLSPSGELLLFGDQEHGRAPRRGTDNILVCGLRRVAGTAGNIRKGLLGAAHTGDGRIDALTVRQLTAAEGGRDPESLEDAEGRVLQTLSSAAAVTAEDYKEAVLHTGGLVLRSCRVLAGSDAPGAGREVTVVVQGGGRAETRNRAYEENIRRKLNQVRLAATPVRICWPLVIRLQIGGRLVTAPYYGDAERLIRERILAFLEERSRTFGEPFSYGDFYCALDLLECVQAVEALTVEPLNGEVFRTQTDDILIPPNGLYALGGLQLDLLNGI